MNNVRLVRLLAAGAALTLVAAACGDDDDASDDTTPATIAATPTTVAGGATTPTPEGTSPEPAGTDAAPPASAAAPGGDNPELAADCQTLFTFAQEDMQASEALALQVGDEITDEHREQVDELIGQLEDLDLQTDEGQEARDVLIDLANEFSDADEVTEDLGSDQFVEFESFSASCMPYLASTAATGG